MAYTLKLEPLHNSYLDILNCFNQGKPLSAAQINFLRSYHVKLSDPTMDALLAYYGVTKASRFNFGKNALSRSRLSKLKDYLFHYFKDHHQSFELLLTPKQFFQFRALLMHELIFFHGNQLLTGAPYFPGGVPHVDFVQWGNLFGVVKYEEVLGEVATNGNILIVVEEMQDRHLEQCIRDYQARIKPLAPAFVHQLPIDKKEALLADVPQERTAPVYAPSYSPWKR